MAETDVVSHYSSDTVVERMLAAVAGRGHKPPLDATMFFPFDQLHGREIEATREHIPLLGLEAGWKVLDVGSGIGGPARYIASTTKADVIGLDLTPSLVRAATDLSGQVGLSDRVQFLEGNAAEMPFPSQSFDAAICFYVGMNLPDKLSVLGEISRVLKPGRQVLWTQVVEGTGEPIYPLPFADTASSSHAGSEASLLSAFESGGLTIDRVVDETQAHVELAQANARPAQMLPPEHLSVLHVVLGEGFAERRRNYIASLASGALRSVAILAHR